MAEQSIDNPILNAPCDSPEFHFELGLGGPTGVINLGRRPNESCILVPSSNEGKAQAALDFDAIGERRGLNALIIAHGDDVIKIFEV